VALGIKQLTDDPYQGAFEGIAKGAVVTCEITEVHDKGIDVTVNDILSGSIKKSDLSRERSEQRPDRFAVGEKVDAKVTSIDKKKKHLSLSIKQREIDEDKQALETFGSTESGASLGDILGAALQEKEGTEGSEEEAVSASPEQDSTAKAEDKEKKDDE
jgi:small subunit ribosomal protein S1